MVKYCESWQTYNPGLDYRFYDDAGCRDLVAREFPQYLDCYDRFLYPIQRADFFRYLVVYRYGGLYADIDMECLQPFDRFFELKGALFSIEMQITRTRQRELGYRSPYQLANCIFATEPFDPFLGAVIARAASLAGERPACAVREIEDVTGPRMLTRTFFDLAPDNVTVLNQIFWMPPFEYPKIYPLRNNMYACHHFYGSWKDGVNRSCKRAWIERGIFPTPFPNKPTHMLSTVALNTL